jgi:hypothetical protein
MAWNAGSFSSMKFENPGAGFFAGDPALIQAQGSVARALAFAEAEALRRQRELLIDYGDPALAAATLKEDPKTGVNVMAAEKNPFSILEQLGLGHKLRERDLNESTNQANLFYGSERARLLGLEGTRTSQEKYNAARDVSSQLADINATLMTARLEAQSAKEQAAQAAYDKRIGQLGG